MIPRASEVLTPFQYGAKAPEGTSWPLNKDRFTEYWVNRVYPTVQGEGRQAGTPMTIIRLQGCPVGCSFCDTPETWSVDDMTLSWWKAEALAAQVGLSWALVTGGEPTWHDLGALTAALRVRGIRRALETSGVYPITGLWDWVTISPKPRGLLPLDRQNLRQADEVKWIVGRAEDVQEIEHFVREMGLPGGGPRISLQPVSCSEKATALCLGALMRHPDWYLSLQTHKMIGIA